MKTDTLLKISIALMVPASLVWLSYEFYRLLWQPEYIGFYKVHPGAIDLKLFFRKVYQWEMGKPLFSDVYPPASYMMLWPLLGWMNIKFATGFWAATASAALAWLAAVLVRESHAGTRLERLFVVFMPLCMYATGATIGNGQLGLHILPLIIIGILMLEQEGASPARDTAAAVMFIFSLVKPTVSAPFFWIILFRTGRIRPAALVVSGYLLISVAAAWQPWIFSQSKITTLSTGRPANVLSRPQKMVAFVKTGIKASTFAGESNIAIWMGHLGLARWIFPVSLVLLMALGCWVYYFRRTDIWTLLGVTAIIARFWTYHRWYDDILILFPMICLFRMTKTARLPADGKHLAGILLGAALAVMIAPGGLYLFPDALTSVWTGLQSVIWGAMLIFLMVQAPRLNGPAGLIKVGQPIPVWNE